MIKGPPVNCGCLVENTGVSHRIQSLAHTKPLSCESKHTKEKQSISPPVPSRSHQLQLHFPSTSISRRRPPTATPAYLGSFPLLRFSLLPRKRSATLPEIDRSSPSVLSASRRPPTHIVAGSSSSAFSASAASTSASSASSRRSQQPGSFLPSFGRRSPHRQLQLGLLRRRY